MQEKDAFANQAQVWDSVERSERAKSIAGKIEEMIADAGRERAMEFGCGTGLISFNLRQVFQKIDCFDVSPAMIAVLQEKIKEQDIKNLHARCYDIAGEEMLRSQYDCIYSSMALHHVEDVETVLRRLYIGLKENGQICIVDLNEEDGSFHAAEEGFKGHNGFAQGNLRDMLEKIGYKNVLSQTFYHGLKKAGEREIEYSLFIITGKKA